MKFSELWLREWVNVKLDSKVLSEQITMAGIEVDNIKPVAGKFHGVIIGEIVKYNQHPNVDRLNVMKVNVGSNRLLNIVCDAPNCHQGLKVAVATVGAVLSGNLKVKAINFYGELSEGILCSFSDLGIYWDYTGIIELPVDATIGTNIRKYLKLDDNTIEVTVTPNRADCLSIIGIARDIAALNKIKLNEPKTTTVSTTIDDALSIQVDVPELCPRYLGRLVKDINVKIPTPVWMKEKLRRCGVHSINVVIDITNYILLELGQPVHAFDKDRIKDGIVVRMAKEGETITILDNKELKLSADTVVISDDDQILSIAGIFGSKYSSINRKTQNVLLECAFFKPSAIASCARRHFLHTDSSQRYEHGVDPLLQNKAIEQATRLLIDICGGKAGPIVDITSKINLPKRTTIVLSRNKLDRLIGYHICSLQVKDILLRLGFEVIENQNEWRVLAPSWRFDIEIEEDLIEEVTRIYGYNIIPNKPIQESFVSYHHESTFFLKRVKNMLNDKGYHEVITYSFVDPKLQQLIHPGKEALIIPKPISNEMSVMRLSLWTGLLKTIIYNQNRQQNRIRIFESGLRFIPDTQVHLGVRQDFMLAGAISGNRYEEHWDILKRNADFYDMKGDLESIFYLTGKLSGIKFHREIIPALHPGQSAAIHLFDECIGFIGVIHPELERKFNLNSRTVVFEIEWKKISDRIIPKVQKISQFPENRRDIAVIVSEKIPSSDILEECKRNFLNHLVSIKLFDVYRGKEIPKGYKSLTISLILQDTNRTLKEEEIASDISKCVKALKERFQALLRN